jgi:hypothetical protein
LIALYIIAAHMAGDYLLQTHNMAMKKLTDWYVRMQHVWVYSMCFVPVAHLAHVSDGRALAFLYSNFAVHFVIDSRRWASGEVWPPRPVLIDQSLHAVTLAVLAGVFLT